MYRFCVPQTQHEHLKPCRTGGRAFKGAGKKTLLKKMKLKYKNCAEIAPKKKGHSIFLVPRRSCIKIDLNLHSLICVVSGLEYPLEEPDYKCDVVKAFNIANPRPAPLVVADRVSGHHSCWMCRHTVAADPNERRFNRCASAGSS